MQLPSFRRLSVGSLFLLLALVFAPALAGAQTVINSVPYTINTPGQYILGTDLTYNATSGNAITFNIGNVTLDFNGHYLSGLGAGKGTFANGLYSNNHANITVKNGQIAGFYYGIYFSGTDNNTGNVVDNMRLPSNTYVGIYFSNPTTCLVENSQVNKTGGTTNSTAAGGIDIQSGTATLRNNQVSVVTPATGGTGYGIFSSGVSHFIIGNQVDGADYGIYMSSAKYQNNLTANCTTPFFGGVNAGNNN